MVVGAGVVGLTCAVRLAEAGYDVHVLARDLPLETTSAVAAAMWYPYRALPQERVSAWAATTYAALAELAAASPDAGVDLVDGVELLRRPSADPWWRAAVPSLDRLPAGERPPGYADGWALRVPVADMSVYLPWLVARLEGLGGTLTRRWLDALPDTGVVVNCTGLAARRLASDLSVRPVRGQVVRLERGSVDRWLLDGTDPSRPLYVVPRRADVVVGGTAEDDRWDRAPNPAVAAAILDRATALEPRLAGARVLGHHVGLRPVRPAVRLDVESRPRGTVVHCYGHGGAGVTLSWGCADEVVRCVAEAVDRRPA